MNSSRSDQDIVEIMNSFNALITKRSKLRDWTMPELLAADAVYDPKSKYAGLATESRRFIGTREQIQRSVIKAIREYATEHYSDGGWDVIVEAYDDQDIAEIVGNVSSLPGAIAKFATIINVYSDRQADAVNSAF
jgi:hypothetical protein